MQPSCLNYVSLEIDVIDKSLLFEIYHLGNFFTNISIIAQYSEILSRFVTGLRKSFYLVIYTYIAFFKKHLTIFKHPVQQWIFTLLCSRSPEVSHLVKLKLHTRKTAPCFSLLRPPTNRFIFCFHAFAILDTLCK